MAASGKTVFFSSHILSEVEAVATWVAIIRQGRLVLCDELEHLKNSRAVVRLEYAGLPDAAEIEALRLLPGVVSLGQEGRSVRLVTGGDREGLTRTLRERPSSASVEVQSVDLTLEDLFLEYMKESHHGHEGTH